MKHFETIQDLKNRLESSKHTLEQTKRRIAAETKERNERQQIEAELAAIQQEIARLAWSTDTSAL
jgi:hypothetical protein